MPNFLLTYSGGTGMPETEAEQAEVMAAWGAWYEQLGEAVVDGGAPLGETKSIRPDGSVSETPANALTGYTIISADDLDQAVGRAEGCPILKDGGVVDVGTAIDMG